MISDSRDANFVKINCSGFLGGDQFSYRKKLRSRANRQESVLFFCLVSSFKIATAWHRRQKSV